MHRLEGRRFRVSNVAGSVEIRPARTGVLLVEVHRGGADAERLRVVAAESRGEATLGVRYPWADTVIYPAADPVHSGVPVDREGALGGTEVMTVIGRGAGPRAWAELALVGGVDRMEVTAPTGPVTLSVPAGFGARVRIVHRGDRRTDFAETLETQVLGDGSGAVSVRTGPRPVTIEERGTGG